MLAAFLKGIRSQNVMDGVQLYKIPADRLPSGSYVWADDGDTAPQLGFFLCSGGTAALHRQDGTVLILHKQEILLFSGKTDLQLLEVREPLMGYCLTLDIASTRSAFESVYRVLDHLDICDGRVERMLEQHNGCIHIPNTSWNESAFAVLRSLPYAEQGRYSFLKIAELLYMLCAHHELLNSPEHKTPVLSYPVRTIRSIQAYMEAHLDEKMTIDSLSRQFQLSPTALKIGFRSVYGQPIHTWLLGRRIQRAADLLQFSRLSILDIAQSVGYESISQFNLVFKRHYGVTPSQYRKMSNSITI